MDNVHSSNVKMIGIYLVLTCYQPIFKGSKTY